MSQERACLDVLFEHVELAEIVVLADPLGIFEERRQMPHQAASPAFFSKSASRHRSMARGAASRLSQPCHVNCSVILQPRKPWK